MRGSDLTFSVGSKNWPCRDCKERTVGCHAKCAAYTSHKEFNQVLLDKAREEAEARKAEFDISHNYFDREAALYSKRCQQRGVSRR